MIATLLLLQLIVGSKFCLPTEPGLFSPILPSLAVRGILQNQGVQLPITFAKADLQSGVGGQIPRRTPTPCLIFVV